MCTYNIHFVYRIKNKYAQNICLHNQIISKVGLILQGARLIPQVLVHPTVRFLRVLLRAMLGYPAEFFISQKQISSDHRKGNGNLDVLVS
jgi:hypothetical protein